jgi:NAD(P)H dehydrogenase (quinone)
MIVVTGATGQLGRRIVERLLEKMPANEVAASVRHPHKALALAQAGVRVRYGNFAEPDSLATAFAGASQLLIVSSNAAAFGGDPLTQHRAAIVAAKTAGVRRVIYTSHMGAAASSAFPPMLTHAATEDMLRQSGVAWTALRNGFYASTVPMLIGDATSSGVLNAPQDGKVSWTAHSDLAAAAVAILLQDGRFEGATPPLTAAAALSLSDIAAILSELYGRPIERRVIEDQAQADRMVRRCVPSQAIDMTMALYEAARAGEFQRIDPTLATLIGRAPVTVREMLNELRLECIPIAAING